MITRPAVVAIIAGMLLMAFGFLLYLGVLQLWGPPSGAALRPDIVLQVPYLDRHVDLTQGIAEDVWESVSATEIPLTYQVTVLPWGSSLVSPVLIKAFHDGTHIYFYASWHDATEDRTQEFDRFPDAFALMFPLGNNSPRASIMMGFLGKVNIWHWKGNRDAEYWMNTSLLARAYSDYYYPFEEQETLPLQRTSIQAAAAPVAELISTHIATLAEKSHSRATGRGVWRDGRWHLVIKNPLAATDAAEDVAFNPGQHTLIAFGIWDGSAGDRGSRKSISDWVILEVLK